MSLPSLASSPTTPLTPAPDISASTRTVRVQSAKITSKLRPTLQPDVQHPTTPSRAYLIRRKGDDSYHDKLTKYRSKDWSKPPLRLGREIEGKDELRELFYHNERSILSLQAEVRKLSDSLDAQEYSEVMLKVLAARFVHDDPSSSLHGFYEAIFELCDEVPGAWQDIGSKLAGDHFKQQAEKLQQHLDVIEKKQTAATDAATSMTSLGERIQSLKSELNSSISSLESFIKDKNSMIVELQNEKKTNNQQIQQLKDEQKSNNAVASTVDQLNAENEGLKEKVKTLEGKVKKLEQKLQDPTIHKDCQPADDPTKVYAKYPKEQLWSWAQTANATMKKDHAEVLKLRAQLQTSEEKATELARKHKELEQNNTNREKRLQQQINVFETYISATRDDVLENYTQLLQLITGVQGLLPNTIIRDEAIGLREALKNGFDARLTTSERIDKTKIASKAFQTVLDKFQAVLVKAARERARTGLITGTDLKNVQEKLRSAEERCRHAEEKLQIAETDIESARSALISEREQCEAGKKDLEARHATIMGEKEKHQTEKVDLLRTNIKTLTTDRDEYKNQHKDLTQKERDATFAKTRLESKLTELETIKTQLATSQSQCEKFKNEQDTYKEERIVLREQNKNLIQRNDECFATRETLQSDNRALQEKVDKLQAEMVSLKEVHSSSRESTTTDLQVAITTLEHERRTITRLSEEKATKKQELAELREKEKALHKEVEDLKTNNTILSEEIEGLKLDTGAGELQLELTQVRNDCQIEKESLNVDLTKAQQDNEQLKQQLDTSLQAEDGSRQCLNRWKQLVMTFLLEHSDDAWIPYVGNFEDWQDVFRNFKDLQNITLDRNDKIHAWMCTVSTPTPVVVHDIAVLMLLRVWYPLMHQHLLVSYEDVVRFVRSLEKTNNVAKENNNAIQDFCFATLEHALIKQSKMTNPLPSNWDEDGCLAWLRLVDLLCTFYNGHRNRLRGIAEVMQTMDLRTGRKGRLVDGFFRLVQMKLTADVVTDTWLSKILGGGESLCTQGNYKIIPDGMNLLVVVPTDPNRVVEIVPPAEFVLTIALHGWTLIIKLANQDILKIELHTFDNWELGSYLERKMLHAIRRCREGNPGCDMNSVK